MNRPSISMALLAAATGGLSASGPKINISASPVGDTLRFDNLAFGNSCAANGRGRMASSPVRKAQRIRQKQNRSRRRSLRRA